jgi:DNA mismatch repair protein MutL
VEKKIHILKPELANRIAAGEVVQRPASAVKELIENSIDAGATEITIVVRGAGSELIHVLDNGEGMNEDDALVAFQRHATSKIASPEDLEHIRTLGFRGEALASIAAVSQVEMKTRTADDELATSLRLDAGAIVERTKASAPRGTSVMVRNLFFNTPARRNFLKSRQTELKNITDVVTRMALAYHEIAWRYISEEEVLFDLKPATSPERVRQLFGERQAKGLVPLHEVTDYLVLEGFIGKPDFTRKTRAEQYLYLNRRSIVSRALQHAVYQAYEHGLEKGAFPFFILNVTVDPHAVDVNVHPSKLEVKFENESLVYRTILSAVKRTLAAHDLVPSLSLSAVQGVPADSALRFEPSVVDHGPLPHSPHHITLDVPDDTQTAGRQINQVFRKIESHLDTGLAVPSSFATKPEREAVVEHRAIGASNERASEMETRAIWQVHNKYILSQIRTGLMIVDQHVAHERILYERVLANFENSLPACQQLLFPQTLEVTASDYQLIGELMDHLSRLGFDIKLFGRNTVVIEGIPSDVRVGNESRILQDLLDEFKNNEHNAQIDVRENLAKSFACKAAIKAGDKLNTAEMISLIDQLFATSMPYVCPHGRPVVVKIPIEELDRRFGRL